MISFGDADPDCSFWRLSGGISGPVVQFNALNGTDKIVVNDLTGTDVTGVNLDLSSSAGSGTGDNQPDTVVVNGIDGDDVVLVVGGLGGVSVLGLSAAVNVVGSEPALDRLVINTLAGSTVAGTGDNPLGLKNLNNLGLSGFGGRSG